MKYTSLNTEKLSQTEKGEGDYLLDEDLVKPVPVSPFSFASSSSKGKTTFKPLRCLCKTLIVIVVLLTILMMTFAIGSFAWARHQVRRITVPASKDMPQPPLPVAPIPQAELEVIKDEAKLFWDQLRADMEPTNDLIITEEQLNGLIASSDYLRGHAFVTLADNQWHMDLVLPANKLPGGRGRYFMGDTHVHTEPNEEGTRVTTQITPKYHIRGLDYSTILNGQFWAYFTPDSFTGLPLPVVNMEFGQFLNWVAPQDWIDRKENLLDCNRVDKHDDDFDRRDCQELMSVLGRLESISLQDGQIVLTPRRSEDGRARRQLAGMEHDGDEHEQRASKSIKPGRFIRRHQLVRRALKGIF